MSKIIMGSVWNLTTPFQTAFRNVDTPKAQLSSSSIVLLVALSLASLFLYVKPSSKSGFPVVNRTFPLEPSTFARLRWAFKSIKILDESYRKVHRILKAPHAHSDMSANVEHHKYGELPWVLARGDRNFLVLPAKMIPELNSLPQGYLDSRKSHATTLTGNLNGMDVVNETNQHVKLLLNKITPAFISTIGPASRRINDTVETTFPKDTDSWTLVEPLEKTVHCVLQAIALTTFGLPISDDPRLIRLCYDHVKNMFSVTMVMRLVPNFLQPALVWLSPDKWRLRKSWKELESFVVPELHRRRIEKIRAEQNNDLISLLYSEAKDECCSDPKMLTRLVGANLAGGTFSTAAVITSVLADLIGHPEVLEEIRREIREKHERIKGRWDAKDFDSLDRLDSAMKESSRLSPGTLLIYSRYVEKSCVLSDGTELKAGQFITCSGRTISRNPSVFPDPQEYKAFRAYEKGVQGQRPQPFPSIDGEDLRWGSGRWACPGRFIANLVVKMILVKLLDEYDFEFVDGKRPETWILHEFVFFSPDTKFLMRRRKFNSGITFDKNH